MGDRAAKLYLVLAFGVIGSYQLLPAGPWWKAAWLTGMGYATAAIIMFAVRRLPRRDRLPWSCFAAGILSSATGVTVSVYCAEILHVVSRPTPAEPFFLVLYPACTAGLWLMIHRRETRRNWVALIDAAIITTGLALLAWVYAIQPAARDGLSVLGAGTQIAYPIGDLVLLALTVRLARGAGTSIATWCITGSLVAFLTGDNGWVIVTQLDRGLENVPWLARSLDLTYLLAYLLLGVAALHPGAGHGRAEPADRSGIPAPLRSHPLMLLTLAAASLIAPIVLAVQVLAGAVTNGLAVAIGSAALFLLVMTRMAVLLRYVELQARQVRELSLRDELTGLANRRGWNDELPRALDRARRTGLPVSVALLDLDRFKTFNDTHGHPAGDRLLKEATAAWQSALRRSDTLARYGGEEFIVLLPDASTGQAVATIERALATTPLGQTFSAGVTTWDGVETADELVARADTTLYAAKDAGRNRVVAAPGAVPPGVLQSVG